MTRPTIQGKMTFERVDIRRKPEDDEFLVTGYYEGEQVDTFACPEVNIGGMQADLEDSYGLLALEPEDQKFLYCATDEDCLRITMSDPENDPNTDTDVPLDTGN